MTIQQPTHDALTMQVQQQVGRGWMVTSASPTMVTLTKGHEASHLLHFILTVCTFGLWLPVWFVVSIANQPKSMVLTMRPDGGVYQKTGNGSLHSRLSSGHRVR